MSLDSLDCSLSSLAFRPFVVAVLVFVGCSVVQADETTPTKSDDVRESRPNIVLIVTDDLGIFDLGCYGRTDHRTPHLDRLAMEGLRFTNGYCGLPICSASRAALMTSKYPARLHLTSYLPGRPDAPSQRLLNAVMEPRLVPTEQTMAEALRREGYRTGLFGKWHLGGGVSSPKEQGFDVVFEPPGNGNPAKEGGKNENLITERAIEFLRASGDQPCLCYIPHHSPHIMLKEQESRVSENASAWNPLYASAIESLDASIGRLMQAIDDSPELNNTWVIFTSDNGGLHVPEGHRDPVTHNGPFRAGKGYLYEGGLRVPLLMRWPGRISPERVIDTPVSLMDLLPTMLNAIGIDPATSVGPLDGRSILPMLDGTKEPTDLQERSFYWHLPHYTNQGSRPSGAMRKGRWKLVQDYESKQLELFDLDSDAGERENVAAAHTDITTSMKQAFDSWKTSIAAQECSNNPNFDEVLHRQLYIDRDPSQLRVESTSSTEIGNEWAGWRQSMNAAVAGQQPKLKNVQDAVFLDPSTASVHGTRLRFEPETYKNVLGYWTEVEDWANWQFNSTLQGRVALEIHCGCGAGNGGAEVDVVLKRADGTTANLPWVVRETGHFQNIVIEPLGHIEMVPGATQLEVRPRSKRGVAIVDIRQIVLRPVP
jgi:arylsulfatase A